MNKFYKCSHCDKIMDNKDEYEFHQNTCLLVPENYQPETEEHEKIDNNNGRIWNPPESKQLDKKKINWWDVNPWWFYK